MRGFVDRVDLDALAVHLPDEINATLRDFKPSNAWVPEVPLCAMEMAHYRLVVEDRDARLKVSYDLNRRSLESPLYAFALRSLSARRVLRASSAMWGQLHRGSSLSAADAPGGVLLTLTFPPDAYFLEKVESIGQGLLAACHIAGETAATLELIDLASTTAVYRVDWHHD